MLKTDSHENEYVNHKLTKFIKLQMCNVPIYHAYDHKTCYEYMQIMPPGKITHTKQAPDSLIQNVSFSGFGSIS